MQQRYGGKVLKLIERDVRVKTERSNVFPKIHDDSDEHATNVYKSKWKVCMLYFTTTTMGKERKKY